MNYEVTWRPAAIDHLAAVFLRELEIGGDAEAITRASAAVDRVLAVDPQNVGESGEADERRLIANPLTVVFQVVHADRVVRVLRIHRHGSR